MSVLNTTTADSEARYVSISGDPRYGGFRMVRKWPAINPVNADTLITNLNAVDTYGAPQMDRQTYSGKFIHSRLEPSQGPEGIDITQELVKVTAISTHASLPTAKKQYDKSLLDPINKAKGYRRVLSLDYMYLDPASDTKCDVLADTALESKAGSGWDLIGRQTNIEENRTMTFSNLFERDTFDSGCDTAFYTQRFIPENYALNQPEEELLQWPNLPDTTASALDTSARANAADMTSAKIASPAGHVLSFISKLPNSGQKTYSVTRQTVKPIDNWTLGEFDTRTWLSHIRRGDGTISRTITNKIHDYQCTTIDEATAWLNNSTNHDSKALVYNNYTQPRSGRVIATAQWIDTEA